MRVDDGGESTDLVAALRAAATPDLYRGNTFRQTDRDVMLNMPDRARKRRNDPVTHAVDDFFWFWPAQSGPGRESDRDIGMAALQAGDPERADAAWEAAGTDVAHHNLAVLNHMLALEADHSVRVAATRWRRSYKYWRAIWRSDPFWDLFAGRLARRAEPGLGPPTAATFREQLPLVLARIGARVALRWAERRQPDEMVMAHWQLVEYDGFPEGVRVAARRAGADSIVALTRARLAHADGIVQRTPWNGAVAARRVREKVGPALDTLTRVRADGAGTIRDDVAEHLFRWTATFVEATGNWVEGLRLLYMVEEMSPGYEVGQRIGTLTAELHRQRKLAERPGMRIVDMMTLDPGRREIYDVDWPPELR